MGDVSGEGGGGPPGWAPGPAGTPQPPYGQPAYPPPPRYPAGGGYPPGGGYPAGASYEGYQVQPVSPYASWGARLGGWLIDWAILALVGVVIGAVFNAAKVARVSFHMTNTSTHVVTYYHLPVLGYGIQVVVVLLYGAILCGGARGQTVGMMAVGARAVDATTGGPIGFWRALWRAAFEYLLFIVVFLPWVLDMLWPLWDARNQTLHDKVSATVVLRRQAPGPGPH